MDLEIEKEKFVDSLSKSQKGHYKCSELNQRRNTIFGLSSVVASTVASCLIFFNQPNNPSIVEISIPSIAIIAAISASIQTFARYQEQSESHRVAAARYGSLLREMRLASDEDNIHRVLDEWKHVAETAPTTPARHREPMSVE